MNTQNNTVNKIDKSNKTESLRDFSIALMSLKRGYALKRECWHNTYITLAEPAEDTLSGTSAYITTQHSLYATLPFIAIKTSNDEIVPWMPTQQDILATDWTVHTD